MSILPFLDLFRCSNFLSGKSFIWIVFALYLKTLKLIDKTDRLVFIKLTAA